ncbi:TRAF3-interacting protein 1 isoform X6 [Pelodiscus sinensis]|uniref:TRAF3-interacting protein 1 isoform X6 n=1 Tax=Pelodiscus sinensis TaxID=13735 RepID=UPI003F6C5AD4
MDGAVVRRTQESLGRVIRKPPLTERLLSKPPFRYLHDVIGEVIRVTGFMNGLYTDFEMKSDNVKDKDAKISFLQKAIDVVIMVTGEPLAVKPARVVAGHEPERTNEFLQAIGKCCLNKLSSDDAVKRVLAGERADIKGKPPSTSKSQDKENRESRAEEQKSHKDKEGRGDNEIKDRSSSHDRKPREELKEGKKQREKERDKHKDNEDRHKDLDGDNLGEGEKHAREKSKNRTSKQGRELEKSREKEKGVEREKDLEHDKGREKERRNEGGKEKEKLKERDKEKGRDKDRERGKDRERDRRRERGKDEQRSKEQATDKAEKKSAGSEETLAKKTERSSKDTKTEPDKETSEILMAEGESPARIPRQSSTKGPRQRIKAGGEGESASDAEGEAGNQTSEKPVVSENGEVSNDLPPPIIQRRPPRPNSARPAPPRIKRQESAEVLLPERNGSDKAATSVIRDTQNSDDEDDQFVVEAAPQLPEMPEMEAEPVTELDGDETHGGLVKRILETKRDYETSHQSKPTEKEKPLLSEATRRKEKDLVSKEIEKFRASIQTLCRSALPLGKIMDYIQEDMDSMKNELQMWQHETKRHAEALQKEQSITDSAVEPLKAELAELEQLIRDQQDKICAVKANILKKEEKIQKMVLNINLSTRR